MLTKADFQRLRALREKKHREELGQFVVEGPKVVAELLAAGFGFEQVYATAEGAALLPPRQPATAVTAEEMARISHFPTPSPLLAVGRIQRPPLAAGALDRGLTLALDGVQDAGNVGTRHPGVARGCGLFGLGAAVFFEVVASAAWRGHFHWPTFALACGASAACGVVGLRRLRRSLHPAARPV